MSEYMSNNDLLETLAIRKKRLQNKLVTYYNKKNNIVKYHFER